MSDMNNTDPKGTNKQAAADSPYNDTTKHANHSMPLWFNKSRSATYYILGVVEVLLGFRFIFKLLGANTNNGFVAFLYSIAGIFTAPFSGIFNPFVTSGLAAKSILEPSTIIAMVVYAVLAWSLVGLFKLIASKEGY